jgi:hypothetical protein
MAKSGWLLGHGQIHMGQAGFWENPNTKVEQQTMFNV